jgi:hypothetical protein
MVTVLLALGGAVFLLLGLGHGALTIRDLSKPSTFTPPDENLRHAMQASSVKIHPTANLWKAWMGFNLSHALGVVVFGGSVLTIAIFNIELFSQHLSLRLAVPLIGLAYVVLAKFFWFRDPLIGTTLGTGLLAAASLIA